MELSDYLQKHKGYKLIRDDYKIDYIGGTENVRMGLYYVINNVHPEGKWRVAAASDSQLCQYFGESFDEAISLFEKP